MAEALGTAVSQGPNCPHIEQHEHHLQDYNKLRGGSLPVIWCTCKANSHESGGVCTQIRQPSLDTQ